MNKSILAVAVASLCAPLSAVQAEEQSSQETLVVTASRFEQDSKSTLADVDVITQYEIQNTQAKTLPEVLRKLPGVDIAYNGGRGQTASVYVRGTGSDQVLVLVDGVRFARAAKGAVDFNQISLNNIERIEYIRGARASIYGSEAIGGVINIITKAHSQTNTDTELSLGLGSYDFQQLALSTGTDVGDNGHVNIALAKVEDEGFNVKPLAGLNDGDRHGSDSLSGLLGYTYDVASSLSLYGSVRLTDNTYQYDDSSTYSSTHQMKEGKRKDQAVLLGGLYQADQLKSELKLSYQYQQERDYNYGESSNSGTSGNIKQPSVQWSNFYQLSDNTDLIGGIDWRNEAYQDNNADATFKRSNTAAYGIISSTISAFMVEASARLDDNQDFGSEEAFSIALGYDVTDNFGVKSSYGTAFKAPNLYHVYNSTYGNADLSAEKSKQAELTIYGVIQDVEITLTGYDYTITDLIDYSYATNGYLNIDGESRIKGVELTTAFDLWASHQVVTIEYKDARDIDGEQLSRRAPNTAKWNSTVPFGDFDWSLSAQYVGRRDNSQYDTVVLPSYSLFDTTLSYYANEHTTIRARVDNLFNRVYETADGYAAPERAYYLSVDYVF